MAVSDVVDSPADGVQQGGAAPDSVLLAGNGRNLAHLYPVVEHFSPVVKEDSGDEGLAGFLLLLFQHGRASSVQSESSILRSTTLAYG